MKDWYYFWGKLSLAVCINSNHNYFNLNLNINILIDIICMTQPDFWKSQFQCTKGFESLDTNLIFVIPLSLQPDDLNLWYFKLTLLYLTVFIVWNVNGLQHWVAAILKLENQSLWQKLNSFTNWKRSNCRKTRILWHGRPNGCGMEDRTVVAYDCRKTKKLICGMKGENVVAYGRLPFPALFGRTIYMTL